MEESLKLLFTMPSWQRKIINQVIKENNKSNPNLDLIKKALSACIKTGDETLVFAFAYYNQNIDLSLEAMEFLLNKNPKKWVIPCYGEITDFFGIPIIDKNKCIDILMHCGEDKTLCKFAKKFGHEQKILDYLMQNNKIDFVLEYAKNIKCPNFLRIGQYIKDYSKDHLEDKKILKYLDEYDKIFKREIKKSKNLEQIIRFLDDDEAER